MNTTDTQNNGQQQQRGGVVVDIEQGDGIQKKTQGKEVSKKEILPGSKKFVYDISQDEGLAKFLADIAQDNGRHQQAAAIRGKEYETGIVAGFKRTMEHKVTVSDVVVVFVAGALLFLVYEGVAYKFDLPRAGIFDPKDPVASMKAGKK